MNLNTNHPSIIKFLIEVSDHILGNISVEHYFGLPNEKRTAVLYAVFKLIKSSTAFHVKLSDDELGAFIVALWKKNEEIENYEFAGILKDISNNFDSINDITKPTKRVKKEIKKERKSE